MDIPIESTTTYWLIVTTLRETISNARKSWMYKRILLKLKIILVNAIKNHYALINGARCFHALQM